jgi:DNA-binding transcriptional LysR family regulator
MDLKEVDLNLLLVFHQLFIHKRVSLAAKHLGLTQPTISNALSRLRKLLDDEVFMRTSRGMEPTPYAIQLAEPIAYALRTIQETLSEKSDFDPATSIKKFTIAMTDIGEIYFLPKLLHKLALIAPGVTISTVRNASVNLSDEIEAGRIDIAIGLLPQLKSGYFQRRLFKQRYVCMFRKGHALDKGKITLAEFARAQHVAVISSGTGHAKVDESIERRGIKRNILLTVPHFVAVGHILSTTDMVATVPERYALKCVEPFGLCYVRHPVPLPEIGINLFWHAKFQKEPGNQWLRGVVFDTFSD